MANHGPFHANGHTGDNRPACFADRYCQRHCIDRERFMHSMLRRSMHRHARPLIPLIKFLRPMHFAADYDFIEEVGWLRDGEDCQQAVKDFAQHPANGGFLRRWLRLRVSVRHVRRLLREIYGQEFRGLTGDDKVASLSPFERSAEPAPPCAPVPTGRDDLPYAQN